MIEQTEHILIGAYWHDRKISAGDFISACYRFLIELKTISSVFSNRCVAVKHDFVILPDDYASFERIMVEALDDPELAYINPNPTDRSFTLGSTLPQGFVVSFSDPDEQATTETVVSVRVIAGAYGSPLATASTLIELPPLHASLMNDAQTARRLLNVMIQVWKPEFASIYSRELIRLLDPFRKKRPCGAWMYFADNGVAAVIGDAAAVERLSSDGTVIRISASSPFAASTEAIRTCYERLSKAGFLDHPHT